MHPLPLPPTLSLSLLTPGARPQLLQTLSNVQLAWLDLDRVFVEGGLREWHRGRQWMFSEGETHCGYQFAYTVDFFDNSLRLVWGY